MKNTNFRYGFFLSPTSNDPVAANLREAEERARQLSCRNDSAPVAIWGEDDRPIRLIVGKDEFVSVAIA